MILSLRGGKQKRQNLAHMKTTIPRTIWIADAQRGGTRFVVRAELVPSNHCVTAASVTVSRSAVGVWAGVLSGTRVSKEKFSFLSGLGNPTQTNETIQ